MNKKIKLWQWLNRSNGIVVILIGLTGWLVGRANYQAGKYLLGWDSVWSEANIGLSFRRALTGLWQEFQGVGLQGGHGYVSDLIHATWLWLIYWFVPLAQVRYVSVVLLWIVGAWGGYYLIRRLTNRWLAITSSFVYMFHPFIVQQFFVPHDSFIWLFAFLPWSLLAIISLLTNWSYKRLFYVFLTQILLSFAGFIPPQMLAYLLVVSVILLCYLLDARGRSKKVLILGLTIFAVHSFWFLPFVRYGISGSETYLESKLNKITTPENDLKSESFGGWSELITGKSYYFESLDIVNDQIVGSTPIFTDWASYWRSKSVVGVLFGLFGIAVVGWLAMFWQRKWWKWGMGASFVLVISGIANRAWPLSYLGEIFHLSPIIDQAFRIGFTKFSIIYVLLLGVFVALGLEIIGKLLKKRMLMIIGGVAIIGGILVVGLPVFQGKMFYERMRVELPSEYINLIEYMKSQETEARIAVLPAQTYNGWQINSWGYTGSGFLFYGVEQSMLDRAFDVWSPYNEGFYGEFSSSLYGTDKEDIKRVLDKYDVRYILLDESVISPGQSEEILRIPETKKLAEELGWEIVFSENFLSVWRVPSDTALRFISAPRSYVWVEGATSKVRRDVVFGEVGHYVSAVKKLHSDTVSPIIYPFAGLMREELENMEYGEGTTTITQNLNLKNQNQNLELIIPELKSGEVLEAQYHLDYVESSLRVSWEPIYTVNGQEGPKLPVFEVHTRKSDSVWVTIGEGEAKFVKEGETTNGSARLMVGEPIKIEIFEGKGEQELSGWEKVQKQQCGEENKYECWALPLSKPTKTSLLQTITHYQSESGLQPEVCLDLEGEPYQCENVIKSGVSPLVITQKVMKGESYWFDLVVRGRGIEITEPGVVWYPQIGTRIIKIGVWEEFENERRFDLQGETMKVEVGGEVRVYDFGKLGKREIENCDVLERGTAKKNYTEERSLTQYIADERGAGCDYVEMSELKTELPYLMRLKGENVEGRSIKFFLYNTGSERNDLEFLLNPKDFDQTFSLLPWKFPGSYSLNIETRSFGQLTENILDPVEVRYFPIEQIAGAKVMLGTSVMQELVNTVEILNTKKMGTWLYQVKFKGEGLIKLSQGYDKGWFAWSDGKLLRHDLVDGWSNGWITESKGEQLLVIMYWPQLLEYLGFGLMGVVIWKLVMKRKK